MCYLGVYGEAVFEKTVEKSRFIGYCARTAGEEEAKNYLEQVRLRHIGATHVCYGYVADALGNLQRFSDAGEPQGTAGLPILGALNAQKLCETTVAVVRYFGGVKLGAGGLARAYGSTAGEVLSRAEKRSFEECVELLLTVGYPEVGACTRYLEGSEAELVRREFASGATFTVAIRSGRAAAFCADLTGALNGRVQIAEGARYIRPFSL